MNTLVGDVHGDRCTLSFDGNDYKMLYCGGYNKEDHTCTLVTWKDCSSGKVVNDLSLSTLLTLASAPTKNGLPPRIVESV